VLIYILIFLTFNHSPLPFPLPSEGEPAWRQAGIEVRGGAQLSLFVSLIFISHPIQTESVTYISSRSGVMCTSFYLLSIIFFFKFLKSPKIRKLCYYLISLISFIVSLGIKEMAITLPLTLILTEYFFLSNNTQKDGLQSNCEGVKRLKQSLLSPRLPRFLQLLAITKGVKSLYNFFKIRWYHLPFLFFIPAIFIIRYLSFGTVGHPTFHRDLFAHFFTQSHVIVNYVKLLFFPINLNVDHGFPIYRSLFEPSTILSVIMVFLILIFTFKNIRKLHILSFSVLWFFITLSPTSLIPLEDPMSERWLYLPSIGFCFFLVTVFKISFMKSELNKVTYSNLDSRGFLTPDGGNKKIAEASYLAEQSGKLPDLFSTQERNVPYIGYRRFFPAFLLLIIILLFSTDTYLRNTVWKNEYTLWEDALSKAHNKGKSYLGLGYLYLKDGNYQKGIDCLIKSIKLFPTSKAYNNLAFALANLKTSNESTVIQILKEAISLNPKDFKAYFNLGDLYLKKEDYENAMKNYKKSLEINPKFSAAYWKIGAIDEKMGRNNDALERYKNALKFDPINIEILYSLGSLYLNMGQYSNAIDTLEKLVGLFPGHADAYYNLGLCYANINDYKKAKEAFQKSLQINPNKADVHNNLGVSFHRMGLLDKAVEEYERAVKIDPKYAEAYGNLGLIYKQRGEKGKAVSMFKEALKYDPANQFTKKNLQELGVKIPPSPFKK